ncbi:hypothetical protein NTGZN8_90059 [Candidatus Nitrotoga fabula]|uniref:Uncharacterized protein n=1 Tax=Candidatus Nitrotoga fabula TaxID=2182327 RepID=A0A916FBV0_9PROT|nr:hypothetical protein NTGZN8_90059 [Candidatus Nitrotoga fabula]
MWIDCAGFRSSFGYPLFLLNESGRRTWKKPGECNEQAERSRPKGLQVDFTLCQNENYSSMI